jgi:excinuclease ABC subunit C
MSFYLQSGGQTREEIFLASLLDYYDNQETVPGRIIVDPAFAQSREGKGLQQLLELDRGSSIKVAHTHRGPKHQLWQSLCRNAHLALGREQLRSQEQLHRTQAALIELAKLLGCADMPQRIECYDASHLMGTHTYVGMAVLHCGEPSPKHYRSFKIKDQPGAPDDYAALAEAVQRRVASWENHSGLSPHDPRQDSSFASRPDLVLIDGGAGQLSAVQNALQPLIQAGTQVLSLAKENEEIFSLESGEAIQLPEGDPARLLLQHARDEAHRFSRKMHRRSRDKRALSSQLDQIPGIGPTRRRQLLQAFGSVDGIAQADMQQLSAVLPQAAAKAVYGHFHAS